jgi:hypothetical protein
MDGSSIPLSLDQIFEKNHRLKEGELERVVAFSFVMCRDYSIGFMTKAKACYEPYPHSYGW